jgi:hypothetical protein
MSLAYTFLLVIWGCSLYEHAASVPSAPDVEIRLLVPQPTVCKGTRQLAVEVVILNKGRTALPIRTNTVGTGVSFIMLYDTVNDHNPLEAFDLRDHPAFDPRTDPITIPPGRSYTIGGSISLGSKFFSRPGFYEVMISGTAGAEVNESGDQQKMPQSMLSNWAIFQVEECLGGVGDSLQ